jgi:hypothetical protein
MSGTDKRNYGRLAQQSSVRLQVKIELGGMNNVAVDDGAGLAIAATIRLAVILINREESGRRIFRRVDGSRPGTIPDVVTLGGRLSNRQAWWIEHIPCPPR